jgi:hypothetical protein
VAADQESPLLETVTSNPYFLIFIGGKGILLHHCITKVQFSPESVAARSLGLAFLIFLDRCWSLQSFLQTRKPKHGTIRPAQKSLGGHVTPPRSKNPAGLSSTHIKSFSVEEVDP